MFRKIQIIFSAIVLVIFMAATTFAATIELPQTGQTNCYNLYGNKISCTGTGQDGDIRAGVTWPNPRFEIGYCDATGPCADQSSDCDSNAVTDVVIDHLTGLMWPRLAKLGGQTYWIAAVGGSNYLTLCGYSDWRLPNINELESLMNAGAGDASSWFLSQGFIGIYPNNMWTSTTYAGDTTYAWKVANDGSVAHFIANSSDLDFYMPVRTAQTGTIQLPQTGQKTSYAIGDDGDLKMGAAWANPRFTDNGNGTITDNNTGLVWLKSIFCLDNGMWSDALSYANKLKSGQCGLTDNSRAGDWRLPNKKELMSLIDRSVAEPALPSELITNPTFSASIFWSSTTDEHAPALAWAVNTGTGGLISLKKLDSSSWGNAYNVWPVRSELISDTTPPVISGMPSNIVSEATSSTGTVVAYTMPTANDAVDGVVAVSCSPASGSMFPLGITTVTCGASDKAGNNASSSFTITIKDNTPPVISGTPSNIVSEATSATGAAVSYNSPTAIDAVDGAVAVSCLPSSGSTFALGSTTVLCQASDKAGNNAISSFIVTVKDTTPPVISGTPSNIVFEATSSAGAIVTYTLPTATDAVDGALAASCSPPSGGTFPLGSSTVTCQASDKAGNIATSSFTVTIQDTTPPVISGTPSNIVIEATSSTGAVVSYSLPTAIDAIDGAVAVSCSPASGSTFALGSLTVTFQASDKSGNKATSSFAVTVRDTTPPVIAPHADVTAEATSSAGAIVSYTSPSTTDAVDGIGTAICSPASGSTFALGSTTVTCSASDKVGNAAVSNTFKVTVSDTTPPVITAHPDVTVMAASSSTAVVNYALPTATDFVDGALPVSCSPASGSTFGIGVTPVNCSATDAHGNSAKSAFNVIVTYNWTGFLQPVDNPPIVNAVKAGSAVPLKFSLTGNQGLNIMAAGSPGYAAIACDSSATVDDLIDTVAAGSSSLTYDTIIDQYIYVWKTDKAWAGTCRQLQVRLKDGSVHVANFKLTK
jgi:hypothetical protein